MRNIKKIRSLIFYCLLIPKVFAQGTPTILDHANNSSVKFRESYLKKNVKSDFEICDPEKAAQECVVVLNFDPDELGIGKQKTNSQSDIDNNFPGIIKTTIGPEIENLFYFDLKTLNNLSGIYQKDISNVLKLIKEKLVAEKKCKEVNVFYTGHGENKNGQWIAYEKSSEFKGTDIEKLSLENKKKQEKLLEERDKKIGELNAKIALITEKKEQRFKEIVHSSNININGKEVNLTYEDVKILKEEIFFNSDAIKDLKGWKDLDAEQAKKIYESKITFLNEKNSQDKADLSEIEILKQEVINIEEHYSKSLKDLKNSMEKYYIKKTISIENISTDSSTIYSDSCHSGSIMKSSCSVSNEVGRKIIASAGESQLAQSQQEGGFFSLFQSALLSRPEDEKVCLIDLDGDGSISYNELNIYYLLFNISVHNQVASIDDFKKKLDLKKNYSQAKREVQSFATTPSQACFLKVPKYCQKDVQKTNNQCESNQMKLFSIQKNLITMFNDLPAQFSFAKESEKLKLYISAVSNNKEVSIRENTDAFSKLLLDGYRNYLTELYSKCENNGPACNSSTVFGEVKELLDTMEGLIKYVGFDESKIQVGARLD